MNTNGQKPYCNARVSSFVFGRGTLILMACCLMQKVWAAAIMQPLKLNSVWRLWLCSAQMRKSSLICGFNSNKTVI